MATPQPTEERLSIRVRANVKERINEAAALQGRSVTDFVTAAALGEAQRVIEREKVMTLGERDSARLRALIANPPEPTKALRELLARR